MSIFDKYPSKFLKTTDIEAGEVVTIKDVKVEEVGQDREEKPTISFREHAKRAVLNKTNATTLAKDFGDDETKWGGKKVILTSEKVRFAGKITDSVMMTPAGGQHPVLAKTWAVSLPGEAALNLHFKDY
jgi:hypothetical protein